MAQRIVSVTCTSIVEDGEQIEYKAKLDIDTGIVSAFEGCATPDHYGHVCGCIETGGTYAEFQYMNDGTYKVLNSKARERLWDKLSDLAVSTNGPGTK